MPLTFLVTPLCSIFPITLFHSIRPLPPSFLSIIYFSPYRPFLHLILQFPSSLPISPLNHLRPHPFSSTSLLIHLLYSLLPSKFSQFVTSYHILSTAPLPPPGQKNSIDTFTAFNLVSLEKRIRMISD
jgi:hypothetical protein